MRHSNRTRLRRGLLSMGLSLLMLSVGCAHTGGVAVNCPRPTVAEIDDYELAIIRGRHESLVRWVSRLVAYCFPEEAEEARRAG